jgi:O-antigen/teichoic acid export membrane protein
MAKTLKEKTAHAIVWTFVDKFGQQVLSFILSVILARFFLSPDDYGLMGMIAIFIVLGGILLDSGFFHTLVRQKDVTQSDLSTVFYFNVTAGILLYVLLYFIAPVIAGFYDQPQLVALCRMAGLAFIINAFVLPQSVTLTRALKFNTIAKLNLFALLCSASISLVLAFNGFGVWVLVLQSLSFIIIRNITYWIANPWYPSRVFDRKRFRSLWSFSAKILTTGILNAVFNNLYALLIGRFYMVRDVGYYSQADKLVFLSAASISGGLQTATYPVLAQIGHEEDRLKRAIRKMMRVTAFVAFPSLFGLAATASPLIHTLLSDKWISAVPYVQKLAVAWAFVLFTNLHINVFYVKGLAGTSLRVEFVKKGIILLSALCTIGLDLSLLVTGLMAAHLIGFMLSAVVLGRKAGYPVAEQLKDIYPYLCVATVMAMGVYSLSLFFEDSWRLLLGQILLGASFYLGAVYILGSKVLQEVLELMKRKKEKIQLEEPTIPEDNILR